MVKMLLKDFLSGSHPDFSLNDPSLGELIVSISKIAMKIKDSFQSISGKKVSTRNSCGEEQIDLDIIANNKFLEGLKEDRLVQYIVTEELDKVEPVPNAINDFSVVIDPIDGSSIVDVNMTVGSIIGIYSGHFLQKGSKMKAAVYFLYGPKTTMMLGLAEENDEDVKRSGVYEFEMNVHGEFFLTNEKIKIPDGKIYSPGALKRDYLPPHSKWINRLEKEGYTLRYSGSFVADVNQILHHGGVFSYPSTNNPELAEGKIRLLYEANPMGLIVSLAGGAVSNGRRNILDITPTSKNMKTPIYIGGKKEVECIEKIMLGYP